MFKESSEKLVGNDAFEGFAIDLIAEIAQILSKLPSFSSRQKKVTLTYYQSSITHSSGLMMELMVTTIKIQGNGMD